MAVKAVVIVVEEEIKECAPAHRSDVGPMGGVHTVAPSVIENMMVILMHLQQPIHEVAVLKNMPG